MDWSNLKDRTQKEELRYVIVMIAVLGFAVIGELLVKNGNVLIYISDFASVSLVIIQIQATVQTLSIALLALVSGRNADSYMGVNYNDFSFNILPSFFKQKIIIFGLIILLVLNVFFHMFGFYNVVVAVFLVACGLVGISVKEVYSIFVDQISIDLEIESYYLSLSDKKVDLKEKENAFKKLCTGWRKDIETQSNWEYEKYQKVFNSFLGSLVFSNQSDAQILIETETSELLRYLCKSESTTVKEKSLCFLEDFYNQLWRSIVDNKEESKKIKQGIHVLSKSYYELSETIKDLNVSAIEKNISLKDFVENVVLCNFWLGYKSENNYEMSTLSDLVYIMGMQLKNNASYNGRYWGSMLEHFDTGITVWPDQYANVADKEIYNIKLQYAILLVRIGRIDILKNSYFSRAVKHIYHFKSDNEVKLFLKIQCYLYYMAYYENLDCISVDHQETIKQLLLDKKTDFRDGAEYVAQYEDKYPGTVFNESLIEEIVRDLRPFELFPRNDNAKLLVLPDAVDDFVVFLSMYLSNRYYQKNILSNIVKRENEIPFYIRYLQNEKTVGKFSDFLQIVDCNKDPQIMLNEFRLLLNEKIKQTEITEAHEDFVEAEYEKYAPNYISEKILAYLNEKFHPIISENVKSMNLISVPILTIHDFSNRTIEEILHGEYDTISQKLINQLSNILYEEHVLDVIKRNTFKNDDEFFSFLLLEGNDTIIGSEYSVRPSSYSNRKRLDEILSSKNVIMEGYTDNALIVRDDSFHIFIHDISIKAHSGTLNDEDISYDSTKRVYLYEVKNGIPIEFSKEELTQYLHERRKIVDIVILLSVKIESEKIGSLLISGKDDLN